MPGPRASAVTTGKYVLCEPHAQWSGLPAGSCLNIKTIFPRMGIPMLKIRRSWDRLIFNMGIPIQVRRHHYTAMLKIRWSQDRLIFNMGIPILVRRHHYTAMLKIRWSQDHLIFNMWIPILVRRHHYTAMLKIRWSQDHLIFNMGIPIPVRRHHYTETAPHFPQPLTCVVAPGDQWSADQWSYNQLLQSRDSTPLLTNIISAPMPSFLLTCLMLLHLPASNVIPHQLVAAVSLML